MKLTTAFLVGTLFGGGFGLIAASIAWDMHCTRHQAEISHLLAERFKSEQNLRVLEHEGTLLARHRKAGK